MTAKKIIDLDDVYDGAYDQEVVDYRHFVTILVDQIFKAHFVDSGLLARKSSRELLDPATHPSNIAAHFVGKLLAYYQDRGDLTLDDSGFYQLVQPLSDDDPGDTKLKAFLRAHPQKTVIFDILVRIRDNIGRVIFKGEDSLLAMACDDFRQAMKIWERLNAEAPVKSPCHQLVLRVIKKRAEANPKLRIFEGGAGVGAVLRDLSQDPDLVQRLVDFEAYYFTDISLSLIRIGREWLRLRLPAAAYDRLVFKVVDLNRLDIGMPEFVRENTFDMVIFEHVLYDLVDLHRTLVKVHQMLKADGILVFTMAYRLRPRDFFIFELLQSTFQSYYHARLEPGYREHSGYLTVAEWEKSLIRAGFQRFEVYPDPADHGRWPYGGIVAYPCK